MPSWAWSRVSRPSATWRTMSAWCAAKRAVAALDKRADRDDREVGVELHARQGVAGAGVDEGVLERRRGRCSRWRRRSGCRAGRRRPPCAGRRRWPRHGRCRRPRTPAPGGCGAGSPAPARRVDTGPMWPPASEPSMISASAPGVDQALRHRQRGREADGARPFLGPAQRGPLRHAARQHHVAHAGIEADVDQRVELGVHGDEVDSERPAGQRLGGGDLGGQGVGAHGAAGNDAEAAGCRDGGTRGAAR